MEGNLYKAETIILENNSEHGHKTNASSGHGEKGVGKAKVRKKAKLHNGYINVEIYNSLGGKIAQFVRIMLCNSFL